MSQSGGQQALPGFSLDLRVVSIDESTVTHQVSEALFQVSQNTHQTYRPQPRSRLFVLIYYLTVAVLYGLQSDTTP